VIVAAIVFSVFWLRLRVRKIDRNREKAREALAKLARVSGPSPAIKDRKAR
jgi:hypothetical protein